jgi:hypothetical protein
MLVPESSVKGHGKNLERGLLGRERAEDRGCRGIRQAVAGEVEQAQQVLAVAAFAPFGGGSDRGRTAPHGSRLHAAARHGSQRTLGVLVNRGVE